MAAENRLWGAERIRGELLKLGIRVAKRTVQKYMRQARPPAHHDGQTWRTFLRNHSVWACDFLQTYAIWFRPIFAFFIVDINTKRVLGVRHFERVLKEYCAFFSSARPHQSLQQSVPVGTTRAEPAGARLIQPVRSSVGSITTTGPPPERGRAK